MYKSPIEVHMHDVKMQVKESIDEKLYQAVVSVGINVDKKELLRALAYAREQYVKGYADGIADGVKRGWWVHLGDDEWCCSQCGT